LPKRFVRIRYFGLLPPRCRTHDLATCREILAVAPAPSAAEPSVTSTPRATWPCPRCGAPMRVVERLSARQLFHSAPFSSNPWSEESRQVNCSPFRIALVPSITDSPSQIRRQIRRRFGKGTLKGSGAPQRREPPPPLSARQAERGRRSGAAALPSDPERREGRARTLPYSDRRPR
jgi:hypothetical protein